MRPVKGLPNRHGALAILLVLSACSKPVGIKPDEQTQTTPCTTTAECQTGESCVASVCTSGVDIGSNDATCTDAKKNGSESDVDCGGSCVSATKTCSNGKACVANTDCASGTCTASVCAASPDATHCTNQTQDKDETGLDCGGADCAACAPGPGGTGDPCTQGGDCASGVCGSGSTCAAPTCTDTVQNGNETAADCGGTCAGAGSCTNGLGCANNNDCTSGYCDAGSGLCKAPSCSDGVLNGDETLVDCDGSCAGQNLCADGVACANGGDCQSEVCGGSNTCSPVACDDGVQNGNETAVDCGGTCTGQGTCGDGETCANGLDCTSGVCNSTCSAPSCFDGVQNQNETTVDCGGSCVGTASCGTGDPCSGATDCSSGVCNVSCVAPACPDGVKNGNETGLDCGGPGCDPCDDGVGCSGPADCASGVCDSNNLCAAPTCFDVTRNGNESGVDCGGTSGCGDCANGKGCTQNTDCESDYCAINGLCAAPTCSDSAKNGTETDQDCGGSCPVCVDGKSCGGASDCQSGVCNAGSNTCSAPACPDGVKNGNETDFDCGGNDCALTCAVGQNCLLNADCASDFCDSGVCGTLPHCFDSATSDGETDRNCGGTDCVACADGKVCALPRDCQSGICTGFVCVAPSCTDGVKNGSESGIDCGGASACGQCGTDLGCTIGTDCTSGVCGANNLCKAPVCGDGVKNGADFCDGSAVNGVTCSQRGYLGGQLKCKADCSAYDDDDCLCEQGKEACSTPSGGSCVSTVTDPLNCGGCGVTCSGSTPYCSAGGCTATCPAPLVGCGGRCVDTRTDSQYCALENGLGTCPAPAATETCTGNLACNNGDCVTPLVALNRPLICGASGSGPPIKVSNSGGALDCAGNLAAVTFRWGICACDNFKTTQDFVTDGFDSSVGPYQAGGLGAGVGANGTITLPTGVHTATIYGALWSSNKNNAISAIQAGGPLTVYEKTYCGGNLDLAKPSTFNADYNAADYDGDTLFLEGNATGNGTKAINSDLSASLANPTLSKVTVAAGRTTTKGTGFDVPPPCDCDADQLININNIIAAHQCNNTGGTTGCLDANNDNEEAGLNPNIITGAGVGSAGGLIELECGHYYFSSITPSSSAPTTIHVKGNVAIYIGGDVNPGGGGVFFAVEPTAQLDVFVGGSFCATSGVAVGSPNYPANTRVYIDGGGACSTDSLRIVQGADLAANFYAPYGTVDVVAGLEMYGSIFTKEIDSTQPMNIHYDRAVVKAGAVCSACGDGKLDASEACDGLLLGGKTCDSVGFDTGILTCNASCGLDTTQCTRCGDNVKQGVEQCDGPDLGSATCSSLGFEGGTVTCSPSCQLVTTACTRTSGTECGNDIVEAGEQCEPDTYTPVACGGVFSNGSTSCTSTCTISTAGCGYCGDGIVNGDEVCDGNALNGATCQSETSQPGQLFCFSDCGGFDTSSCGQCTSCRDCDNQACTEGACGSCFDDTDCCSPLRCNGATGVCELSGGN